MFKYFLTLIFLVSSTLCFGFPRNDSNFAFGGATTNTQNATAVFTPPLEFFVKAAGFELIGLEQQLEFAEAALTDVSPERDVFWLWIGANNILAGESTQNIDPTVAPKEIKAAMTRLYNNVNARLFVVPNLMLLGNIPRLNANADTQAEVNTATEQQNTLLAEALIEFSENFPDATVITLDVQSLFSTLEQSGRFENTTQACYIVGLPFGRSCSDFLYADRIHLSSAAAEKVADMALEKLNVLDIRRIITLGDSFSDTGSFADTTTRAFGFGIPTFPNFEGRFTDGPNVIDHLESKLNPEYLSTAFAQPKRKSIRRGRTSFRDETTILVPNVITLSSESRFGYIVLDFDELGYCVYPADGNSDGKRKLSSCSNGIIAGKNLSTSKVSLMAPFSAFDLSMDLFYY